MYEDEHLESDYEDRYVVSDESEDEDEYDEYEDEDEEEEEDESDKTIEEVVASGMAYLDENYPNHRVTVDLAQLDVADPIYCPLAQATKQAFDDTDEDNDNSRDWLSDHGFWNSYNRTWSDLSEEWVRQYNAGK